MTTSPSSPSPSAAPSAVVFDIGNVLVRWDVRALYRTMFDDDGEMERFLAEVWTDEHNLRCDGGESFSVVTADAIAVHPEFETEIRAAGDRWIETVPGPVDGSFEVVADLAAAGVPLYGITNMSSESYPQAVERFPELSMLRDVVVSGEVGIVKPDRRIFELLCDRTGLRPGDAVFVDDSPINTAAASVLGFHTVTFTHSASLRRELARLGLPLG